MSSSAAFASSRSSRVAAVNGAALGGGVEIALHCDYRTIASSVRHFACPEVFLGLIPGWGGTQLVPQLVGAEQAVRFIVENPLRQNRMLKAQQAFEAGFADALLEPVEFLDESLAFLLDKVEEGAGKRRPAADLSDVAEVCRKARSRLDGQVHGATPAPYRALDLIEGSATWSLEEGYRAEEDALAELLPGPQAQASVYAFNLVERRAKRGVGVPDAEPRRVQRVGIVGAGLMARQLALLFLRRLEVPVVLRDLTQEQVDDAIAWIADELADLVRRGRLGEGKARFLGSLVTGGTEWNVFEGCDLVLEAVFEEMAVKKDVFAELERIVAPECVLATNTSSLSVTEMGADLEHPERVVGMHFFNPVAVLPLVELARTPKTDDASLATVWAVTKKLRKTGVLVRDAPAFVVNRLLGRQGSVVTQALDHGNTVEETDEAVLRMGLPMAPSVLLQLVGPKVANHVRHTLQRRVARPLSALATLESLAEGGEPGRRGARAAKRRRPPHRSARSARRRVAAHPRGGRRRGGGRHRHLPHPRRRIPVLAGRNHEAPRPDGRLRARRRSSARRALRQRLRDTKPVLARSLRYALPGTARRSIGRAPTLRKERHGRRAA